MATETVKLILDVGEPLTGRLLLYDSLRMSFKEVKVRKNPDCDLCGDNPTIHELVDYEAFCSVPMPEQQPAQAAGNGNGAAVDEQAVQVTPQQLKEVLDSGRDIRLVDVREPHEYQINRIGEAKLIPLGEIEKHVQEFNPDDEIYLYCYKGKRSLTALKKLHEHGFKHLKSLEGGIDRWAQDVDTSMPRY